MSTVDVCIGDGGPSPSYATVGGEATGIADLR
jgi:hypothetical protein